MSENFLQRAGFTIISEVLRNILLAAILSVLLYFTLAKPMTRLADAYGTMDFKNPEKNRLPTIEGHEKDELGVMVVAANELLAQLDDSQSRLQRTQNELEERVKERTRHLDQEITERRFTQEELQRAQEGLEKRVEERTRALSEEVAVRKATEIELREGEARLRVIVDHLPLGFVGKDLDGRHLIVNKTYSERYGLSEEEMLGKTNAELFPENEDINEAARAQEINVISSGRVNFREQEKVFADGTTHSLMVSKFPIRDNEQNLVAIGTVGVDVTELKETSAAARISEQRLRDALNSMQEGFALYDADDYLVAFNKKFLEINPAATEILEGGVTYEGLLRANTEKGQFVEALGREEEFIRERVEKHKNPDAPILREMTDGTWRIIKETKTPEGGIALTATDITELKKTEQALIVSKERAEHANRTKTEFLAHMSHELRTPLNAIIGFSAIIEGAMFGPIEDKYKDYASDIYTSGEHLLGVITDILDVSKIEVGEMEIDEEEVNVAELVNDCIKMVRGKSKEADIKLNGEIPEGLPGLVADPLRVKQIMINLLSNAIKFTPERGHVTIGAAVDEELGISLWVSDTGIGIAAEDIPKVLEAFGQVRDDATRTHEGTGIGLSLSKALAELHGGTLEVSSELDKGTTVTVAFGHERTKYSSGSNAAGDSS